MIVLFEEEEAVGNVTRFERSQIRALDIRTSPYDDNVPSVRCAHLKKQRERERTKETKEG